MDHAHNSLDSSDHSSIWEVVHRLSILYHWKGLISGLYDASAGIFLAFKFAYDSDADVSLTTLLIGFACATALIWIKLFFFLPYKETDPNLTAFESSVFGQFCNKDKVVKEEEADEDEIVETEEKKEAIPIMNSILTVNYLLVRVSSQPYNDTLMWMTFVINIYVA